MFNWLFRSDYCLEEEEVGGMDRLVLDVHARCIRNREALQRVDRCGCFYCLAIFDPQEIGEWIEDEGGAIRRSAPAAASIPSSPNPDDYPLTKSSCGVCTIIGSDGVACLAVLAIDVGEGVIRARSMPDPYSPSHFVACC